MSFDINKLTLGEIATVEDLSGAAIGAIGEDTAPKGLALAALAYVARKRNDPEFIWNDALGLTIAEANDILGLSDEEDADPKEPTKPGKPSK